MGRGANPAEGAYIRFCQNFQKMHEIDKLLVRVGGGGVEWDTLDVPHRTAIANFCLFHSITGLHYN